MRTITAKDQGNCSQKASSELYQYYKDNREFILGMFQSLFSDFVNLNPVYRDVDSARDLATLKRRFDNEGLGFISTALSRYMSDVFALIEGRSASFSGFKTIDGLPIFLNRLVREVVEGNEYKEVSFSQVYQTCVVFKKLRGPFDKAVLEEKFQDFLDVDAEVGFIDFNSQPIQPIMENARQLIETVFKDVELEGGTLKPRPGSGATNTPVELHMRFKPHVVYRELDEEFDYLESFYSHSWDPHADAWRYMHLPHVDEAVSRFKFIQKYLGKPRGICIEENEMQFFQQAMKRFLYHRLELHPATRGRINFHSQMVNRELALIASVDALMCTIDMSEASDRVARELVHRLLWSTPLFHQLDAVSTRLLLGPDDKIHKIHKFAPMGSGVCFPVMALIHWALIRSIIKLSSLADSEKLMKQVYVYGDDIIIPSTAAQAVYDYLPLFGMKINTDKSFVKSQFRESCGIHAYNGVDVTPVYANYVISNKTSAQDTTVLLSLVAKESAFYSRGYSETAKFIRESCHKSFWQLPDVEEDSPILGWKRDSVRTVDVLKHARSIRYDRDLQTWEYSFQCVFPQFNEEKTMDESSAYLRNLLGGSPVLSLACDKESTSHKGFKTHMELIYETVENASKSEGLSRKVEFDVEHLNVRRVWLRAPDV
jgi:hypothetical protein